MSTAFFNYFSGKFRSISVVFALFSLLLAGSVELHGQGPYPEEASNDVGAQIFKNQCASCHNKNMKDDLTGPALGGVEQRWAEYPREDLYYWIRNSQGMIGTGHPRAVELWNDWKPTVMTNFPGLTDLELESLLLYINNQYTGANSVTPPTGDDAAVAAGGEEESNTLMYVMLFGLLLILSFVLARVISNLQRMKALAEGKEVEEKTLIQTLTSPGLVAFVVFAFIIFGGYTTVNNAIELGRQQGYQPMQPIRFSHVTHAGVNKIECQYCHDGARRSKHSVIPSTNTCMNCHRAIKKGPQYGTAEITKIFASIGYDPNADKYIDNYEELPREDIEKIYKKWIADNYASANGDVLDEEGQEVVREQWEGIVAALTNDHDDKIAGPIEWLRIHNLPDHAYFNHAQHVAVGKLECQTCHGPVQEMEVVYQYSPLSMGWCINCHRKTPVEFEENPYYESYEQYHLELKAGTRQDVVVEEIGGLECQKCHY